MRILLKTSFVCKALLLVLLAVSHSVWAADDGLLGVDAGIDLMSLKVEGGGVTETNTKISIYAKYDHFVPFVPNALIRTTSISSHYVSFTKTDITAYYSFLDNSLSTLDVGATHVNYGSDSGNVSNFRGNKVQLYANVGIDLAPTPVEIFAQANFDKGLKTSDRRIGIAYNMSLGLADFSIRMGQYQLNNSCSCANVGISGWFLGASGGF